MTMKPEFKKVWVDALRSGEFKQGKGTLRGPIHEHAGYEYCCLGVACIAWKKDDLVLFSVRDSYSEAVGYPDGDGNLEYTELPHRALDEVGLTVDDQSHLIHLNDQEGKSFAEIADYIEANL